MSASNLMSESELISALAAIFQSNSGGFASDQVAATDLIVDIGDDAAIIQTTDGLMALSTDLLTEGTHFKLEYSDLYSIGRKAAVANLADIFAMGIKPKFFLLSIALDERFLSEEKSILQLAQGIYDQARDYGVRIIGGDVARSDRLTISITALGSGSRKVMRSGAKPGDGVFVTELPGRSFLGLHQLQRGLNVDFDSIAHHQAPKVDFDRFFSISKRASALCDISDGLLSESGHIARASGVDIKIYSEALKKHPDFENIRAVAQQLRVDAIVAITESGEEHCPIFTSALNTQEDPLSFQIGEVVAKSGEQGKVSLDLIEHSQSGFSHF